MALHCNILTFENNETFLFLLYNCILFLQGKSAAGSAVLRGSIMESMLQSLYLDNRAGYYFTQFCEKSGNKV